MPITEKQLTANRANAAKSTGPQRRFHSSTNTPDGNARSHGFTASTFAAVRLEDLHDVAHLKTDQTAVYQPVNSQELFVLDSMALTQQPMLRAARGKSGLFTNGLDIALNHNRNPIVPMSRELAGDGDIEITRAQNRNYAMAEGFHRMARQANTRSLFLRYQAQAERHYRRAVEEFERLKRLRAELPNEPILDVQPEESKPACAPRDEPISTPQPNPEPSVNSVSGADHRVCGLPGSRSGAALPDDENRSFAGAQVAVSDYLNEAHTHLDVFGANALFPHYQTKPRHPAGLGSFVLKYRSHPFEKD